jgi:hypothetical protein
MDKRKIRGIQLSDAHSVHYFQMSDGELSMTVDCVHGNCIITEKELLSYLQTRNSLNAVERNDSGGVAGGLGTANKQSTSASQIADSIQAACLPEPGLFISPRESWVREWCRQLRTLRTVV